MPSAVCLSVFSQALSTQALFISLHPCLSPDPSDLVLLAYSTKTVLTKSLKPSRLPNEWLSLSSYYVFHSLSREETLTFFLKQSSVITFGTPLSTDFPINSLAFSFSFFLCQLYSIPNLCVEFTQGLVLVTFSNCASPSNNVINARAFKHHRYANHV